MPYATISEIARRWKVDRATARAALQAAQISPSELHASPRFSLLEVVRKIEKLPLEDPDEVDPDERLYTAEEISTQLGVTTQTVRNYGRAGRVPRIEITPNAIRYAWPARAKNECEAKTGERHKK
ncbi:hypothetical protein [Phaeovulum sp. NW3]|uniref:MerR family transcriptional regulator n=1 Tax=Phaeovulum sp. NW3 TaxID=2934933 RepID=UPI002021FC30|nr:hypothetical protein [Phaeovulum sp. NW3]MCL7466260.1 hypothetical protein [Phaeovulum sp. NW3]